MGKEGEVREEGGRRGRCKRVRERGMGRQERERKQEE
jgi:hypothetical protein